MRKTLGTMGKELVILATLLVAVSFPYQAAQARSFRLPGPWSKWDGPVDLWLIHGFEVSWSGL